MPNFWTTPNQLSKSQKNVFFGPKIGQITDTNFEKMAYFSSKNSILVVLWKFFWVDTRRKYGPFKSKNNPQTVLKQLPNNLEKSQNLSQKYAHRPPSTVHRPPPTK